MNLEIFTVWIFVIIRPTQWWPMSLGIRLMYSARTEVLRWKKCFTEWAFITRGTTEYTFHYRKTRRKKVRYAQWLLLHFKMSSCLWNSCIIIIQVIKCSFLPGYRCPGAILHPPEHFSAVPAHMVSRDQKCSQEGTLCPHIILQPLTGKLTF